MSLIFSALLFITSGSAQVIIDKSELAQETVLPVFDEPASVLRRNVLLKERSEIGLGLGLSLIEAFHQQAVFGLNYTYNLDEETGINIAALIYSGGLSDYSRQLMVPESEQGFGLQMQYAPEPGFVVLGQYQHTVYYGKMSVSKKSIMNLHLYGLLGGGVISFTGGMSPAASAGLGQKFYFSPSLALRFDLNFLMYQGPNLVKGELKTLTAPKPASEFPQELTFSSYLTGGLVFLF